MMADFVISQRDFLARGGETGPATIPNLGRYRTIVFASSDGTAITKVEASVDGTTFFDITGVTANVNLSITGLAIVTNFAAKTYRITGTGSASILVNAN